MQRGQGSIPGSSLAQTLEVISQGFDIDADELWSKKSRLWRALGWRLNRMSCCVFPLGLGATGPGLQPQPAWGVSARLHEFVSLPENARGEEGGEKKKLFVQREMSVNQLMELSVEV